MGNTYLFDFDGTLVDSMPTFVGVMLRILDENGISYGEDIVRIITPLGYLGTARYFRTLGIEESEEELVARMKRYAFAEYETAIPSKKGVAETLLAMRARGDSLNVLTASPHSVLDICLSRLGLMELFDNVWSCDDFALTKADAMIYHEAAKRLGKRVGDVIFVDDNVGAVRSAKAAGMKAVGIFDETSAEYAEEFKKIADGYVVDFCALFNF